MTAASILLIEDDPNFSGTLVELLSEYYQVVECAASAAEAVAKAQKRSFHLLITDIRIAGQVDGVGALEAVKAIQPRIRSIIMTGYADLDVPIRAARLHADDYLQKPFALSAFLQSVRSVLEREAPFRGLFQKLVSAPGGATQKALRLFFDGQWQQLSAAREACLKRFFVLARSQRLDREQAYSSFCRWEELELDNLRASAPPQWSALAQAYRDLDWLTFPRRSSETLTRALFMQLFEKIQTGQVESIHLHKAIALLHQPEVRRENVESYCTYHWLWSDPAEGEDPFKGLTIQGYLLKTRRNGPAQEARLYEATHASDTRKGHLIVVLPAQPESEELIAEELGSARAILLQTHIGHHFLLYRSHALSLQFNLPPEGVSGREAWTLLRPVFVQVANYHSQGKYSGCFSLSDVECLPGQPCQLSHFSDRAYRQQHERLLQGGTIPVELYSAPEIHQQPEPSAASDQAVLGRLLFEVVLGGSYPDPSTRVHLRFLGTPLANEHLRPWVSRLAPLTQAFYRLCHANPGQRFRSLSEAISTIDAIVAPV
ncbi:MAG: response regulator [Candidatus Eremiobacteraeota bacterium]|nr:response regulator [Candidatus Eremiobacteraeota bacterium]MCW5866848.1 response regulator [Candidatus Eremiobacteraeota bacterium]